MVDTPRRPPSRMTVPDFVDWDSGDHASVNWQLIDGEPTAMAPANQTHGALQAEMARLIGNHLFAAGSPCRVIISPGIIPRVRASTNFRVPDLCVTRSPPTTGVDVPDPVLLVEIISPGHEPETRANIWSYTTIPSVQEILVLHSTRVGGELLRREQENWPEEAVMLAPRDMLELASIAWSVRLDGLYVSTALFPA